MLRILIFISFILSSCQVNRQIADTPSTHNGHAHNDYEHSRPLFDALQYGFRSIEVDVHAWDDRLMVAHDSTDFTNLPDIMDLYLNPLDSLIANNVLDKSNFPIILMVDLKTRKESALHLLNKITNSSNELFYDGSKDSGPIQMLISGDPSLEILESLENPYLFIDGRFNREYPSTLQNKVTRISGRYFSLFGHVNGEARKNLIKQYLTQAHSENQKVRFWGTKDHPDTWNELKGLGVDWIGTDDLEKFYYWSQSSNKN